MEQKIGNLHVITPFSRQKNFHDMETSLCSLSASLNKGEPVGTHWTIHWYLVLDTTLEDRDHEAVRGTQWTTPINIYYMKKSGVLSGNPQRNAGITEMQDSIKRFDLKNNWVYFLDDDNFIHPKLYLLLNDFAGPDVPEKDVKIIVFGQEYTDNSIRLIPSIDEIERFKIDTAMFLVKDSVIGDLRWENDKYYADAVFFKKLVEQNKKDVIVIKEPFCYYNAISGVENTQFKP